MFSDRFQFMLGSKCFSLRRIQSTVSSVFAFQLVTKPIMLSVKTYQLQERMALLIRR